MSRSLARWPDCATGWHDRCTAPSRCGCRCHEALDHCDACETPGAFRLCCGDHQARMCSRCHEANHEAAS